jgi:hypothetical protein
MIIAIIVQANIYIISVSKNRIGIPSVKITWIIVPVPIGIVGSIIRPPKTSIN